MTITVRIYLYEGGVATEDFDTYSTADFPECRTPEDLLALAQEDYCGATVTITEVIE